MVRHTLFAYVDGSDLDDVAEDLERSFADFVEHSTWRFARPSVVSQRFEDDLTLKPGDLQTWELGLNADLPDPGSEPPGWFADIESIARFLGLLHARTGRNFMIGIADHERGFSEDLFCVDSEHPDLEQLRQIIGVNEDE